MSVKAGIKTETPVDFVKKKGKKITAHSFREFFRVHLMLIKIPMKWVENIYHGILSQ